MLCGLFLTQNCTFSNNLDFSPTKAISAKVTQGDICLEVKRYMLASKMREQDIKHLWGKQVRLVNIPVDGIVKVSAVGTDQLYVFPADGIEWDGMYEERYQSLKRGINLDKPLEKKHEFIAN